MIATAFNEENALLDSPPGVQGVLPLPVFRGPMSTGLPCVVSCWKVTEKELEEIQRTGRVWLMVLGDTMPPVNLTCDSPFE